MREPEKWEQQLAGDVPFARERTLANIRKIKERIRMDGRERKKRAIGPWAAALAVILLGGLFLWIGQEAQDLLTRWTEGPNKNTVTMTPHEPVTLRVVTSMDERGFYSTYGRLLMLRYDWLSFDVHAIQPTADDFKNGNQGYLAKVAKENPDLVITYDSLMPSLIGSGLLKPLDDSIKQNNYKIDALHPAVPALLKAEGNGKLYGLTPQLQGRALFYNKDLFDKYHVPYPKDRNTWSELLALAKRFPLSGEAGNEFYGIEDEMAYSPYNLIVEVAQSADLYRQGADKSGWQTVWNEVLTGYPTGLLRTKMGMQQGMTYTMEQSLRLSQFLSGKAAMSIAGYSQIPLLQGAEANHMPTFQWALSAPPVDANHPDESAGYALGNIFAVANKAEHSDAAWETIRSIVSPEFEKMMLKAANAANFPGQSGVMPSIPSVMDGGAGGVDVKPFYVLKPKAPSKTAAELASKLGAIGSPQAASAAAGTITAQEAFDTFWRQAEPILKGDDQP